MCNGLLNGLNARCSPLFHEDFRRNGRIRIRWLDPHHHLRAKGKLRCQHLVVREHLLARVIRPGLHAGSQQERIRTLDERFEVFVLDDGFTFRLRRESANLLDRIDDFTTHLADKVHGCVMIVLGVVRGKRTSLRTADEVPRTVRL